jgi:hypothetical protein
MVTERDIQKVNSGEWRLAIIRKIKICGPHRVPFDHKNFTLDLKLKEIDMRDYSPSGVLPG